MNLDKLQQDYYQWLKDHHKPLAFRRDSQIGNLSQEHGNQTACIKTPFKDFTGKPMLIYVTSHGDKLALDDDGKMLGKLPSIPEKLKPRIKTLAKLSKVNLSRIPDTHTDMMLEIGSEHDFPWMQFHLILGMLAINKLESLVIK